MLNALKLPACSGLLNMAGSAPQRHCLGTSRTETTPALARALPGEMPSPKPSKHGNSKVAQLFLSPAPFGPDWRELGGLPPNIAAAAGDVATVRFAFGSGQDHLWTAGNGSPLLLTIAAEHRHVPLLRYLVDDCAVDTSKSNLGYTPLRYAARGGHALVPAR